MQEDIVWEAPEHSHTDKSADWFWALGIIAVSGAVVAVLFKNFLFALLIVVGATTMSLLAKREPKTIRFSLTPRGILIDEALYPYKLLKSFWVEQRTSDHPLLIVDAQRVLTPHLLIPLEGVDAETVHTYLSEYLPEEELGEPFTQRLMEFFGF